MNGARHCFEVSLSECAIVIEGEERKVSLFLLLLLSLSVFIAVPALICARIPLTGESMGEASEMR